MKRTEIMFWGDLVKSNVPYNCKNVGKYDALKKQVMFAPERSHTIKNDVVYSRLVNLNFILSNINWCLSVTEVYYD